MVGLELAKKIFGMSDAELAKFANNYIGEIQKVLVGHGDEAHWEPAVEQDDVVSGLAGIFENAWSKPKSCEKVLSDMGVEVVDRGSGLGDGDCWVEYILMGQTYRLDRNVYDKECYVPAIRWAAAVILGKRREHDESLNVVRCPYCDNALSHFTIDRLLQMNRRRGGEC